MKSIYALVICCESIHALVIYCEIDFRKFQTDPLQAKFPVPDTKQIHSPEATSFLTLSRVHLLGQMYLYETTLSVTDIQ